MQRRGDGSAPAGPVPTFRFLFLRAFRIERYRCRAVHFRQRLVNLVPVPGPGGSASLICKTRICHMVFLVERREVDTV